MRELAANSMRGSELIWKRYCRVHQEQVCRWRVGRRGDAAEAGPIVADRRNRTGTGGKGCLRGSSGERKHTVCCFCVVCVYPTRPACLGRAWKNAESHNVHAIGYISATCASDLAVEGRIMAKENCLRLSELAGRCCAV